MAVFYCLLAHVFLPFVHGRCDILNRHLLQLFTYIYMYVNNRNKWLLNISLLSCTQGKKACASKQKTAIVIGL